MRRTAAALAAVALAGAFAALCAVDSLQQDFAAYWVAGGARRLGLDPYVNYVGSPEAPGLWDGVAWFRHSRFLYPPLAAELFRPLAALPYRAAKAIFTGGTLAAWVGAALLLASPRRPWRERLRGAAPTLVAGALTFPLVLHLDRGQIDLPLLLLVLVAWRFRDGVAGGLALAAAAAFKPALLGLLPVLAALGRWRLAAATLGGAAALVGVTAVVSGPALLREYATVVLPRAALYGEGGASQMRLADDRFTRATVDEWGDFASVDGRRYRASTAELLVPWAKTSASLPRLLAPESPSPLTTRGPFVVALAGLVAAARLFVGRRRGRGSDPALEGAELLLLVAALLACVVTSPAGWVMGFVWALPLVPAVARLRAAGRIAPRAVAAIAAAWVACAIPAPLDGWGALAGTALAVALVAGAREVAGDARAPATRGEA